ncbi:hypothetical protein PtB15_15B141 [Puccinia triticina]|nr:hypothetical protein PtB15_15B141 [Puccinia triticina]
MFNAINSMDCCHPVKLPLRLECMPSPLPPPSPVANSHQQLSKPPQALHRATIGPSCQSWPILPSIDIGPSLPLPNGYSQRPLNPHPCHSGLALHPHPLNYHATLFNPNSPHLPCNRVPQAPCLTTTPSRAAYATIPHPFNHRAKLFNPDSPDLWRNRL